MPLKSTKELLVGVSLQAAPQLPVCTRPTCSKYDMVHPFDDVSPDNAMHDFVCSL